jgi:hypothetical protein
LYELDLQEYKIMCSRVSVDLSLYYLAESTKEQLAISRFVDSNEAVAEQEHVYYATVS